MHFSRLKLSLLFILFGCGAETTAIEMQVYEGSSLPNQGRHSPGKDAGAGPDGAVIVEPIDLEGVTVIDVGPKTKDQHANLMGVVSGPNPAYNSLAPNLALHLQDIGMRSVRNTDYYDDRLDMERMFKCADSNKYPAWDCAADEDKNFHWDGSDQIFQSWMNEGIEPMFRLGGSAVSDVAVPAFKGPQDKDQEKNWIEAASQVVKRYLNWEGKPGRFIYLNIWTEFPNDQHWDRSDAAFISFWRKAFESLKDDFGELMIGGPGFSEKVTRKVMSGSGGVAEDWLDELYEQGVKPDWIGWHLYSNNPREFVKAASGYADLLAGTGQFKDVSWAGSGFFDDSLQVVDAWGNTPKSIGLGGGWEFMSMVEVDRIYNRKEGASTMTASWIAMQHSPIERAFYDRFGDRNSDPTVDPHDDNTLLSMIGSKGLFYGDTTGTYKRSAHAVRLWARMVDEFSDELDTESRVKVVGGQANQHLWMLAGVAADGRKAVLVSNPNELAVRWMARFGESQAMANYFSVVDIFQVDGNKDGKKSLLYAGEAFKIPAGTVQLVVFTP